MLIAVVLAFGLAAGVPTPAVALVGLALVKPIWFLAVIAGWAVWHRWRSNREAGGGPDEEAAVLRAAAAELAAGASLRAALGVAAASGASIDLSRAARLAEVGRPMGEVAGEIRAALPVNGRRAAAAIDLAGRTGAAPRRVLDALAAQAADLGTLARERKALTAQARLSAVIVGGAPVVLLVVLGVTGRLGGLAGDPAGRVILGVGVTLLALGITAVSLMVARADR